MSYINGNILCTNERGRMENVREFKCSICSFVAIRKFSLRNVLGTTFGISNLNDHSNDFGDPDQLR